MTSEPTRTPRHVVSFVRRGDRLTPSRQAAWDRLADTYVLDLPRGQRDTLPDPEARLDLPELFGRSAPLVVEIGSGQGENIAAAAAADPARDHLAVEVYAPGLAHTLMRLERADLPPNVRLLPLDAQPSLPQLPDGRVTLTGGPAVLVQPPATFTSPALPWPDSDCLPTRRPAPR